MKRKGIISITNDLAVFSTDANLGHDGEIEDYMKMSFVVPPSDNQTERRRQQHKKLSKQERSENMIAVMKKVREDGMRNPIDESNKGFQLLQKFGYHCGGLGRAGQGIETPIDITDRNPHTTTGVGLESLMEQKMIREKERVRQLRAQEEALLESFKSSQIQRYEVQANTRELHKIRNIIFNLDSRDGVPAHILWDPKDRPELVNDSYDPFTDGYDS